MVRPPFVQLVMELSRMTSVLSLLTPTPPPSPPATQFAMIELDRYAVEGKDICIPPPFDAVHRENTASSKVPTALTPRNTHPPPEKAEQRSIKDRVIATLT